MANTTLLFQYYLTSGPATVELYPIDGGAIQNGASGDTLSQPDAVNRPYDWTATVTEAVTGRQHVIIKDSSGNEIYYGTTEVMADIAATYRVLDAATASIGGSTGSGAHTVSFTLKLDASTVVPDADIWITPEDSDTPVLASGITDGNGLVDNIKLDTGSYRLYFQKYGVNFNSEYVTITVDAEGGVTVA